LLLIELFRSQKERCIIVGGLVVDIDSCMSYQHLGGDMIPFKNRRLQGRPSEMVCDIDIRAGVSKQEMQDVVPAMLQRVCYGRQSVRALVVDINLLELKNLLNYSRIPADDCKGQWASTSKVARIANVGLTSQHQIHGLWVS
jgi:hypothetical protein